MRSLKRYTVLKVSKKVATRALMLGRGFSTAACVAAQHRQCLALVLAPCPHPLTHDSSQFRLTIDSRTNRLPILPDECTCIVVELDRHAILSLYPLPCPYYYCLPNVSSPHFVSCCRNGVAGTTVAYGTGLLYDDYDTITLGRVSRGKVFVWDR